MLPEVADFLPLDFSRHRFIHITERTPVDSTFVLCHTIASAIGSSRSVRLAALARPVAHYRHLLAKTGSFHEKNGDRPDQLQSTDRARVEYIDGSRIMIDTMMMDCSDPDISLLNEAAYDCSGILERLYTELTKEDPCGVWHVKILDGISVLCDLCCAGNSDWLVQISVFLARLRASCEDTGSSLVLVTTVGDNDSCYQQLVSMLDSWADVTVEVRPLATGVCTEVSGVIEASLERILPPAQCQFKARDKDVKVFALWSFSDIKRLLVLYWLYDR